MRILVVGINYAPDLIGVAKYTTELCEALTSFGHEVRVVTAPPYYPGWRTPEEHRSWLYRSGTINRVAVKRAPIYVPRTPTGAKRLIHHASFALTSLAPVISEGYRWRPDVVFSVAPSLMSAAVPAWIARRIGALSWLHLQDFEVDAAFDLGLLRDNRLRSMMVGVERKILKSFDCVSSISPQMVARLESKGVDRERIHEVRNWTDVHQIVPGAAANDLRSELGLDASDFVGLYSGTMSTKQGLELIVEAAKLLENTDRRVRFIMCGEGPHKATLQDLGNGLTNVRFLGLQPDGRFIDLLKTADFHLIPQKAQAADLVLPSKLASIFATGRPAIVMAEPGTGLADEVAGGGLVIPPGDASALAGAVRRLADNPELRLSLGNGARQIAISRWDKTTILSALNRTISELGALKKQPVPQASPSHFRANEPVRKKPLT